MISYPHRDYIFSVAMHRAYAAGKFKEAEILSTLLDLNYQRGHARCPVNYDDYRFEVGIMWDVPGRG